MSDMVIEECCGELVHVTYILCQKCIITMIALLMDIPLQVLLDECQDLCTESSMSVGWKEITTANWILVFLLYECQILPVKYLYIALPWGRRYTWVCSVWVIYCILDCFLHLFNNFVFVFCLCQLLDSTRFLGLGYVRVLCTLIMWVESQKKVLH